MSQPSPDQPARSDPSSADAAPTSQVIPRPDGSPWQRLLLAHRWIPYLLPIAVFLLVGSLEPPAPPDPDAPAPLARSVLGIDYQCYPAVYIAKLGLTLLAVWLVRPVFGQFPWRLSRWAVPAGIAGAVLWIGLCRLHLEPRMLSAVGLDGLVDLGRRSAYNPLAELAGRPALAYAVLAIRLLGLVVVVPVIEELFLRGFVVRYAMHPNWWSIPFGEVDAWGAVGVTFVSVLMHPQEVLAATAWSSGVTWLMVRTRSMGDCVVAHAVTNLLLGLYVLASGDWWLM